MTDLPGAKANGASREGTFAGQGDVALLIDWENLKYSLQHQCSAAPNISSLVNAAREYGRLVVARAYADWAQPLLRVDAPNLYRAGIEPIYVPGRFVDGQPIKNSADVRLGVDSVDLCVSLHHVSTYVLVTGDGDLIHSLNFLRLRGRQVVIVGVTGTIKPLLETAADIVMIYYIPRWFQCGFDRAKDTARAVSASVAGNAGERRLLPRAAAAAACCRAAPLPPAGARRRL